MHQWRVTVSGHRDMYAVCAEDAAAIRKALLNAGYQRVVIGYAFGGRYVPVVSGGVA